MPIIIEQAKRKAIFGPAADECRTTESGDQLFWMGGSPLHHPPRTFEPSHFQPPAKVQIPSRPIGQSQPLIPLSAPWDSPTDIIFYHHNFSNTTISQSLESTVPTSLRLYEAEAKVQRAGACVLGQARPQLLKIITLDQGGGGDEEMLPFTPGTPDKLKGWSGARLLSVTPKEVDIPVFDTVTDPTQEGEPVLVRSLSPHKPLNVYPQQTAVSPESSWTELFPSQETRPVVLTTKHQGQHRAENEMSVDRGYEEDEHAEMEGVTFAERSMAMQDLVERTGMVAKRERHGNA